MILEQAERRNFSDEDRESAYLSLGFDLQFGVKLLLAEVDFSQPWMYQTLWDMKNERPKIQ